MQVSLGEQTWHWDPDAIEVDQALAIKKACGLNFAPFLAGIFELDPAALRGLVWFLRSKDEPGLRPEWVSFRIGDLRIRQDPAPVEEPADPPAPAAPVKTAARRAPRTSKTSKASSTATPGTS